MKQTLLGAACASLLIAASGAAQASLIDRGGGLIYDTDLNITWLADASYAVTSGDVADVFMNWTQANTWATNLSYYDSVRNVTYDDWRLPTTLLPDPSCSIQTSIPYGYNCTGSELGHLFYSELGGVARTSITTTHDADYNLFSNVRSNVYWSNAYDGSTAWFFHTGLGYQTAYSKTKIGFAWAVRPGDVAAAASTVPVPAAAWLFGSGLLGLIGMARRKAA